MHRLKDVVLTFDDVEEVFALYELSRTRTPYGFLANRTADDYRALLRNPEDVIAAGIRDDGRLVAYSICHRLDINPYKDNALLGRIDPAKSATYHGDGTIVHPDYQGRMLAQKLAHARQAEMALRQVEHVVGLVAVDNLLSIGNTLHAGALLVGFARDETAMNYIGYGGRLESALQMDAEPIEVDWRNLEVQAALFARRQVVVRIRRQANGSESRETGQPDRLFSFCPIL